MNVCMCVCVYVCVHGCVCVCMCLIAGKLAPGPIRKVSMAPFFSFSRHRWVSTFVPQQSRAEGKQSNVNFHDTHFNTRLIQLCYIFNIIFDLLISF